MDNRAATIWSVSWTLWLITSKCGEGHGFEEGVEGSLDVAVVEDVRVGVGGGEGVVVAVVC